MKVLDLFCGAGGCAWGYHLAGFEVVGVDIKKQPHYPFSFYKSDALYFLQNLIMTEEIYKFSLIHASPPCQLFSSLRHVRKDYVYKDLITPTRELLKDCGRYYVIENVIGAPLINPVMLCGSMFDLRTYRHRLFESNFKIRQPEHPKHIKKTIKMGRVAKPGDYITVAGHFTGVEYARQVMEIDWMTRDELSQAIPPKYTEYIGNEYHYYTTYNHISMKRR